MRQPDPGDDTLAEFPAPEEAPGIKHEPLRPLPFRRSVERDLVSNEVTYTLRSDGGLCFTAELRALEGGEIVFRRKWDRRSDVRCGTQRLLDCMGGPIIYKSRPTTHTGAQR